MRRGLTRVPDVDAGSAVIATVAVVLVAGTAVMLGTEFEPGELWPFLLLGTFVPGLSQLLVVHAVQAAGAARAGILFGMAPLFSALVAISAFGEPLRWPLAVGTVLVVTGGVALALGARTPGRLPGLRRRPRRHGRGGVWHARQRRPWRERRHDRGSARASDRANARGVDDPAGERPTAAVGLSRLRAAFTPFASSGVVIAVAQTSLLEALDRARVTVVAPLLGTGVLWTVVFAAVFVGRTELIGRRLVVVSLLVVAGGTLVGATR